MGFIVTHRLGAMRRDPPLDSLPALLAELDEGDGEHFEVAVSDENGWTLSVYANGNIVWENVETDLAPRHLRNAPRAHALGLMRAVAAGDLAAVEREEWQPGYPR